ncbi:MAG: AraC family transcriptional regulator [Deltaproteobacteria bacterium]|nr:MAG: AraC family transcriptional regulator [Deltaproteobacteria bacterium]
MDVTVEEALHRVLADAFASFSNLRHPRLLSTRRVGHRHIARAVDYIRELSRVGRLETVTLDELANVAGLSKYHFLREFDRYVGMTPGGYLRTMRLCHAARLLRTTDRSIAEIAQTVGFADHPSFSRAFRRAFGMPPSAYRALGPL